jgi:CDP-paratose 2-epimerase
MSGAHGNHVALITGGAGFIGTNVADRLLRDGWSVRIFDNLSRPGVGQNLDWLCQAHRHARGRLDIIVGDVRDRAAVAKAVAGTSRVFHFAAQVAVTTSLTDPIDDFAVNAAGTLHVLEALRAVPVPPSLLFTSTNKVYGHLDGLSVAIVGDRYEARDGTGTRLTIAESQSLAFGSPYGCSKGAADQYVLDYAATYGLPAAVFRMSCIYGPHQCGTEDQGWVAHFVRCALAGVPLVVYGDGRQVRDLLYVDDLVDAMLRAHDAMPTIAGRAFNIGGGPDHTISLLELMDLLAEVLGTRPQHRHEAWRPADQRYYVSDTRRFGAATGWRASVPARLGIDRLAAWLRTRGRGAVAERRAS